MSFSVLSIPRRDFYVARTGVALCGLSIARRGFHVRRMGGDVDMTERRAASCGAGGDQGGYLRGHGGWGREGTSREKSRRFNRA